MSALKDKVIIITGVSSGIGEATAYELAVNGARVVLAARREERLKQVQQRIEKAGGIAVYQLTDVTSCEQMRQLAHLAIDRFGKIDVLVNNAGLMPLSFMNKLKIDEWDRMVDVNIKGVLYGIAAVLPHMEVRKQGHIISLSSVAGHEVHMGGAVYSATKFAVRAIMEGLRKEQIRNNIRTTIISPGAVRTEIMDSISDSKIKELLLKRFEGMRYLEGRDIATAIRYCIEQPDYLAVNEVIVRPVDQQ